MLNFLKFYFQGSHKIMAEKINTKEFNEHFSEKSFWDKIINIAKKAGKEVIEKALIAYYVYKDEDTPMWAKGALVGALGYFISPIDVIPDFVPIAGYTDDVTVLASALVAVAAHIKQEHKDKAEEKIKTWFN